MPKFLNIVNRASLKIKNYKTKIFVEFMQNLTYIRTSLYCWIILAVFIAGTMVFMINFYNKAIQEIDDTVLISAQRLEAEIDWSA